MIEDSQMYKKTHRFSPSLKAVYSHQANVPYIAAFFDLKRRTQSFCHCCTVAIILLLIWCFNNNLRWLEYLMAYQLFDKRKCLKNIVKIVFWLDLYYCHTDPVTKIKDYIRNSVFIAKFWPEKIDCFLWMRSVTKPGAQSTHYLVIVKQLR